MIFNRETFCKATLNKILGKIESKGLLTEPVRYEELYNVIHNSTTVGICLQELGIITDENYPELNNYLNQRGGTFAIYFDDNPVYDIDEACQIMSFRELLSLFPEE